MTNNKATKRLGWHFLPASMKLDYGDGRTAAVGQTLSIPSHHTPSTCRSGMHASDRPSEAARFEKGPVVTRVEVWGDIAADHDKFCGRNRKVLWAHTLTDADIKTLAKAIKYSNVLFGGVATSLKRLAAHDSAGCDKWFEGLYVKSTGAVGPSKRKFTERDLLSQLMPRTIRTKAEVMRDVRGFFDMAAEDRFYDDRFEELVDDLSSSDKIITIENFTRGGATGYVLRSRDR